MICKKCGGTMEGREDGDTWTCDCCGLVIGEGADDPEFGNQVEDNKENSDGK